MNRGRQSEASLVQRAAAFLAGFVLASLGTWLIWRTCAVVWRRLR